MCQQATLPANKSTALTKEYQDYEFEELLAKVTSGKIPFSNIFNTLLTPTGQQNPWTQQMYTEYVKLNNQVTNNSKNAQFAAQNTAIINTAGTYLSNYITGDDTQMIIWEIMPMFSRMDSKPLNIRHIFRRLRIASLRKPSKALSLTPRVEETL